MISTAIVLSALELGFIYALVAMALFLSFRVLNIADMTTDGAFLDEEWLSRELSRELPAKGGPQELSERIAHAARSAENGREDDISIITVVIGR